MWTCWEWATVPSQHGHLSLSPSPGSNVKLVHSTQIPKRGFPCPAGGCPVAMAATWPPTALPSCSGLGNPRGDTLGGGNDAEIRGVPGEPGPCAGTGGAGGAEQPGTAPALRAHLETGALGAAVGGSPSMGLFLGLGAAAGLGLRSTWGQGREPVVSPVPQSAPCTRFSEHRD